MHIATTDHPTPVALDVTDTVGALLAALGPSGIVVVLALGVLLLRSRMARRLLRRAARRILREAWHLLVDWALIYVRHRIWPTREERRILRRLAPRHWRAHAERRGLAGTITGRVRLTAAGIVAAVRLDGTWTPSKLRGAEDQIRALLGLRSDRRMEITAGKRGGWATLTVRTRIAVPDGVLAWDPARPVFGLDTITGAEVVIPLGERLLIAGMSGAGKSVASRPLLYAASEGEAHALVIIDLKQVEGRLWDHRARVASDAEAVRAVVAELVAEMTDRLATMPKGMDTLTPTPRRPRITVVVDEGAEVSTVVKDAVEGLETLARMGRAACIDLWWMTQKPTIGDGIPRQVAPQMSTRICLAVSTPTEARVVLGEDAQAKGWTAESLPKPGVALVRDGKRRPHPVKVAYMDKDKVMALPAARIWQRAAAPSAAEAPTLTLVKDTAPVVPAQPSAPAAETTADLILAALREGEATAADLARHTGRSSSQVYAALRSLMESGTVAKTGKRYALAGAGAAEVTA